MNWINVKERLPDLAPEYIDGDGSSYLVLVFGDDGISMAYLLPTETGTIWCADTRTYTPGHIAVHGVRFWQPLPAPPTKD